MPNWRLAVGTESALSKRAPTLLRNLLGRVHRVAVLVLEEDAEDLCVRLGGGPVELHGVVVVPGRRRVGVEDGKVGGDAGDERDSSEEGGVHGGEGKSESRT